jgi:hypothetical protein
MFFHEPFCALPVEPYALLTFTVTASEALFTGPHEMVMLGWAALALENVSVTIVCLFSDVLAWNMIIVAPGKSIVNHRYWQTISINRRCHKNFIGINLVEYFIVANELDVTNISVKIADGQFSDPIDFN